MALDLPLSSEMKVPTFNIWGSTEFDLRKVNFTWVIRKLMVYPVITSTKIGNLAVKVTFAYKLREQRSVVYPNFRIKSPSFADSSNDIKWSLSLSLRKDAIDIDLRLDLTSSHVGEIICKYKVIILNAEHTVWKHCKFELKNSCLTTYGENSTTINFNDLQSLLLDDKLTIVCEVHFIVGEAKQFKQNDTKQLKNIDCNLADNFTDLLRSQTFSDVKLVVGEQEFPAHKIVLATRSEVFAAMFQHEMEEAISGQVLLNDVTPEILEEMLTFIYTGKSPNMDKMADELLIVADKYALKNLHAMAELALLRKLSDETAIETLILASRHNGKFLKRETIKYINFHGIAVIKTKGCWETLMSHPDLLKEIFEAQFTQNNQ